MKKTIKLLGLSALLLVSSCSVSSTDINSHISSFSNISYDADDFLDNFDYNSTVAGQYLHDLASHLGYSITMSFEHTVISESGNENIKYEFDLSEKGDLTWASVSEIVDNKVNMTYRGAIKKVDGVNHVYYDINDGNGYIEFDSFDESKLPYSIDEIKGLLLVSGTYIKYVNSALTKKTRTTEINRECVKYTYQLSDKESIELYIDRESELLLHLRHYNNVRNTVSLDVFKVSDFSSELKGTKPNI